MSAQEITIHLPVALYRSASQLARAINRPLADVVQESLAHTLPPLDDVPPEEAEELAHLSLLSDADLWRVAQTNLSPERQMAVESLLDAQNMGELDGEGRRQLTAIQDEYGRLLVRQSHAWLLLARRGYRAPIQNG